MDTFKDVWNSVRLNVLDRLGNPLVGAFCLAWVVWNFRLILIALGSGDWKPKLEYIDKVLMKSSADWVIHGYLIPLGSALAWVFVLPFVFRKAIVFHREQAAKTAKAVMIADGSQPINAEEANKLRLKIRESIEEWEKERAVYLKQVDELSERIAALQAGSVSASEVSTPSASTQEAGISPSAIVGAENTARPDPLVASIAQIKLDKDGKNLWPRALGDGDLERLPSSVVSKVRGHQFENLDIQALLAMRNWPQVDDTALSRALNIEKFDARVILDRLHSLELLSQGRSGTVMNADGRMLTAYFKRVFEKTPESVTAGEGQGDT